MELSHWCLAADYAWNIKTEFIDSFFKIYENYIRQNLKAIPTTINYYLRTVPDLRAVSHPGLWQLILIDFRLRPSLFLSIEYKNVIDYAFFTISLTTAKDYQELTKLCRAMAIPRTGRLAGGLTRIYFHEVPRVFLKVCMLNCFSLHLSSILSLNRWLTRDKGIRHIII